MIRCLPKKDGTSPLFHPRSVASVFSSVCDVREGRCGSFVERIVSLLGKYTKRDNKLNVILKTFLCRQIILLKIQ